EIQYDEIYRRVKVDSLLPEYFHARWEITNMDKLLEVIVAYPIDRADALELYKTSGNDHYLGYKEINPEYLPGIGILWKRWTPTAYQVWVDDVNVISAINPYMPIDGKGNVFPGLLPFIHIKNLQAGSDYWGYSDGESCLGLIDELNRRMADVGDIVNTHAHPIVTLTNFNGRVSDLPVGPDAVWDLGKDGKAERLEGIGPTPELMSYVEAVKKEMYETSAMPETTYGSRGSGGTSHSSGIALSMAMMPVVERSKEKRIFWRAGLRQLAQMTFYLLASRDPGILAAAGLTYAKICLFDIDPIFADILPKDKLQSVNENVSLSASGLRSQQRALEDLGEQDIPAEVKRIKEDMLFRASVGQPTPPPEGTAGKNSEEGAGGSNALPGGISPSLQKPGTMIKSSMLPQMDNVSLDQQPG